MRDLQLEYKTKTFRCPKCKYLVQVPYLEVYGELANPNQFVFCPICSAKVYLFEIKEFNPSHRF